MQIILAAGLLISLGLFLVYQFSSHSFDEAEAEVDPPSAKPEPSSEELKAA